VKVVLNERLAYDIASHSLLTHLLAQQAGRDPCFHEDFVIHDYQARPHIKAAGTV
jgi:thymidylate synthase